MVTTTDIIEAFRGGDLKAFDRVYHQYSDAVFRNIFKIVRQNEIAEEILQDVFLELWESRGRIDSKNSLGGWLMVVSHNKSISTLRKKLREKIQSTDKFPAEIADTLDDSDEIEEKLRILYDCIEQLPPRRREVFTLCKLEGKSYEETAHILGLSIYTVKEHLIAASKTLKELARRGAPQNAAWLLYFLIKF